jgi:hypothetical protein
MTATTCQTCGGRATDAFLCRNCQAELRDMLTDLPWWIDRLAETSIGQANLGDGARRTTSEPRGLVEYADATAATDGMGGTEGDRRLERDLTAGKFGRDKVLAAGRVNPRASRLLDMVQNSLVTTIRDLCESRGVDLRSVRAYPPSFIGPLPAGAIRCEYRGGARFVALWLAEHVSAIAASEDAGQTYAEIAQFAYSDNQRESEIVKAVNRPLSTRWFGKCPTWVDEKRSSCAVELYGRQGCIEVYCRACRQTHKADRLLLLLMNDLETKKITFDRILKANRMQPEDRRVPERTLRYWRQHGKLKVRGYRRPNGRDVINRHSDEDEPLYLWPDVRKLRGAADVSATG